jgi:hypothetical protein
MHRQFVAPQARWADLRLGQNCGRPQLRTIAAQLRSAAAANQE